MAHSSVSRSGLTRLGVLAAAAVVVVSLGVVGGPPAGAVNQRGSLDVYTVTVSDAQAADLARQGHEITARRTTAEGVQLDLVLTASEADELRVKGADARLKRVKGGQTVKQFAAAQAAGGFTVWRSYDEPGGFRDEMYELARRNPQLVKLVVLGKTYNDREIIGLKLTQAANEVPDNSRPAALFSSTQHAREWISAEVNRRLLHWFIDQWRANDKEIKNLLKERELWFVLVANPDGYQYTFDSERLWRKNLRDNNGDGQITIGDGVDPNRNFPEHWNYDQEGSSSQTSSDTYRGPAPGSEPETQAMTALLERVDFAFQVNWHSAGQWLLYPEGWQTGTPSGDDPIYYALSGNLDDPAIPEFHPGLSSDVLYVTNGETTDFAHVKRGTLAWTPELSEGCTGCGFVFPDDPALVQAEFDRVRPFALSVARSAADPDDPVTTDTTGITTRPFYLKSDDTYKAGLPMANFTFRYSYGDPQEVRVLAKRSLGAVTLKYQIGSGPVVSKPTVETNGGERYGGGTDVYYHVMSGTVTGTEVGDEVKVWFEGGGATSDSFTYTAEEESDARVLVLAAEDYSGASPGQSPGPHYLSYYADALTANGVAFDVYDVDARGRVAPDALGVLSHYDGVIWYTGDDVITREPGWGGGRASRLAMDEILEVREFMNAGGRVFYTGKYAGHQYTQAHGNQLYDPTEANAQCGTDVITDARRCLPLGGSGNNVNDALQYWLGAYILIDNAGANPSGGLYDIAGVGAPLTGQGWSLNGADSAGNQDHSGSFITTSGILDPATYPQFESHVAARWNRPGGPYDPHTGGHYLYSQIGDVSYKRLTRTLTVPAGGATLSFWTSYDTEAHWDHVFVEARTPDGDDWTTLSDVNGHTSQDTGDSCPAGWRDLHPQLDHYQTVAGDPPSCSATGTTGVWHAASGNSGGWQQWTVDLGAWAAAGQVEVSIAYASDWSVQGLGMFLDDITTSTGEGDTSFEDGNPMGGWTVTGPPPGSAPNPNNFVRTTAGGFPEGAVVTTGDSLYAGFGFEGITDASTRNQVMARVVEYLLR